MDADAPERARAEDRRARRARRGRRGARDAPRPTPWRERRVTTPATETALSRERCGGGERAAIARGATNRAGEEIGEPTKSPRFAPAGGRASRDLHFLDMEKQCTKKATAPRIICARVSSTTAPPRWFWRLAARSTRSPSPGTPRRAPTSSRATLTRATNEDRRSWVSLPAAAAGIRSACRDDRVRHPPPPTRADSRMATTVFEPGVTRRNCRPRRARARRDARAGRARGFSRAHRAAPIASAIARSRGARRAPVRFARPDPRPSSVVGLTARARLEFNTPSSSPPRRALP